MRFPTLDKIDEQIINLLIENGRMSYVDIAKKVNLSRVAVKSRIESLENQGIIEGYTILINPQKISRIISVFFDIEVEPRYLYTVAEALKYNEYTTDIHVMSGKCNLHVHAVLEYDKNLELFIKNKLLVHDGVKSVDTKIIISRIKVRRGLKL